MDAPSQDAPDGSTRGGSTSAPGDQHRQQNAPFSRFGTDFAWPREALAMWPGMQLLQHGVDYWVDAWQRSILFLDV
ncbi:MAG: hypothetical protein JO255_09495, partial [Alphaproteobacteria bacterium]|nr:hypothetical protein [Alphaproteobacteria bacterium]